MTEFSPPPLQPRSPDQRPPTPTNASNGFFDRWGLKLRTAGTGIFTIGTGTLSLEQFASGHTNYGLLMLIPTTIGAITTGINTVLERRRTKGQL